MDHVETGMDVGLLRLQAAGGRDMVALYMEERRLETKIAAARKDMREDPDVLRHLDGIADLREHLELVRIRMKKSAQTFGQMTLPGMG